MHPEKALSSIYLTDDGILTFSNDEQSLNVDFWMIEIEEGTSISLNEEHFSNADSPINVTDSGIVTSVSDEQS